MAAYRQADWATFVNEATNALTGALGQGVVRSVRLDTAYLPPMDLVGGPGGISTDAVTGEPRFDIGSFLKPKLTIQLAAGNPVVYAPYGDPGEGSWFPILAIAGGLFYLAYELGRRKGRGG
jgi:hypothetical protein